MSAQQPPEGSGAPAAPSLAELSKARRENVARLQRLAEVADVMQTAITVLAYGLSTGEAARVKQAASSMPGLAAVALELAAAFRLEAQRQEAELQREGASCDRLH